MTTSFIANVIFGTARLDSCLDRGGVVVSIGGTGDYDGAVAEERGRAVAADGVLFRV